MFVTTEAYKAHFWGDYFSGAHAGGWFLNLKSEYLSRNNFLV